MELVRYIHPVGQGAFYTEQFFDNDKRVATVVYDCGAKPSLPALNREIENTFSDSDEIDILFISHFHADHINGIERLKDTIKKIKTVVIPYMDDTTRYLSLATMSTFDASVYQLIVSPQSYFEGSRVIEVNRNDGEPRGLEPIVVDNLPPRDRIESGTSLLFSKVHFWEYMPFNIDFDEFHKALKKALSNHGFEPERLPELVTDKENLNKIHDIYTKYFKNLNESSMIVYSGAVNGSVESRNNACLYTGDATITPTLTNQLTHQLRQSRVEKIQMLQIPHHGSRSSFDESLLNLLNNNHEPILFLSCGKTNSYGHPSPYVITRCNLFLATKHVPYYYWRHCCGYNRNLVDIVTEEKQTMLVVPYKLF